MYIGPLYINTKELFLIMAAVLIFLAMKYGWGISWFDKRGLLIIIAMMFATKTLLPALQNEAFFMMAIAAIFLTLYMTVFQVVIFYLVGFSALRWLKII